VKDDNGDLLANSHILNRWKNYFSQLLNVNNVSDVRQIEVYTAEPLVPGPSRLEVEIATAKLKKYKSPSSVEIPGTTVFAGGEILMSAIYELIFSIWNKEELPDQWKESIIVLIHKRGDTTAFNNYCGISMLLISYKMLLRVLENTVLIRICRAKRGEATGGWR
jgi:hypothetical protein